MNKRVAALTALALADKEVLEKVREQLTNYDDKLITSTECYKAIKKLFAEEIENERLAFDQQLHQK